MASLNEDDFLKDISWSDNSYYLAAFISQFPLPQAVRIERGHDGGTENATLGYGEVLTLHALREKRSVVAEDKNENAILLSLDFPKPLEILPQVKDCSLNSCGVAELRSVYQTMKYIEVTQAHYGTEGDKIDSAELGEVFEILDISKPNKPEKTKVHVKNIENGRKLTLTSTCTARFRPLLDWRKYKAVELKTHAYGFPVRVRFLDDGKDLGEDIERFISQNPDINITDEVDDIVVIATTVGSYLVKSCLEIPKDLEIKLKVAEGKQNADIVKNLDERFDVTRFMAAHQPALIKRREVIKKYNYDEMKEFMINKSTNNQQFDEGQQVEGAPELPPRQQKSPKKEYVGLDDAPHRPHKPQGLSSEVNSNNKKTHPDVPLPPKPYATHRTGIDTPTASPKVTQSTTNTAPSNTNVPRTTTAIPVVSPNAPQTTGILVLPSHVFQRTTDTSAPNPIAPQTTTDSSTRGEKQDHTEERSKVKPPKPLPPVRQDIPKQIPSNVERSKSNDTHQPTRKDDDSAQEKATSTLPNLSKDLTNTTTMNSHVPAETKSVRKITKQDLGSTNLPLKREKSFSTSSTEIQELSHGQGTEYNNPQRSTDDPPKLPPKSPARIRKVGPQTSVYSSGRYQVPLTPPPTPRHAIERGGTRQTMPRTFKFGERNNPNENSVLLPRKDEQSDDETIYEEPFYPDHPKVMPVLPQPKEQVREDPYHLVAQIPQDLSGLTVADVSELLKNLKMQEYVRIFEYHQVDGSLLKDLNDENLNDFEMQSFHRTKLLKFIKGWRPNQQ